MQEDDPTQQLIDLAVIEYADKHAAADRRELAVELNRAIFGG